MTTNIKGSCNHFWYFLCNLHGAFRAKMPQAVNDTWNKMWNAGNKWVWEGKNKNKNKNWLQASFKRKKEEALKHNSRIYNIVNKVEVLENINENWRSKWQRDLQQLLMKKYWNRWLILIEEFVIGINIWITLLGIIILYYLDYIVKIIPGWHRYYLKALLLLLYNGTIVPYILANPLICNFQSNLHLSRNKTSYSFSCLEKYSIIRQTEMSSEAMQNTFPSTFKRDYKRQCVWKHTSEILHAWAIPKFLVVQCYRHAVTEFF